MECRIFLCVIYVIFCASFRNLKAFDNLNICVNQETGQNECCANYKNISGICQACIGFLGKNCKTPCPYGFYGNGCNERCHCSKMQTCDRTKGCIDVTTCIGFYEINCTRPCVYGYYGLGCREQCYCGDNQVCDRKKGCLIITNTSKDFTQIPDKSDILYPVSITVGGFLMVIVFGTVCYLQKSIRKIRGKNGDILKPTPLGNACSDQPEQRECIYNDVRESRMIESTVVNPQICNSFQRPHQGNILQIKSSRSLPRQHPNKWRKQLKYASSEGLDDYGSGEAYNHLQFKKMCTLPAKSFAPVNKYCSMKVNAAKYPLSHINVQTEVYRKRGGCNDPRTGDSTTLPRNENPKTKHFRPYSSVKYNRNAGSEKNIMY